ncbi:MAG: BrnT family toxin [Cyanobacteria bacterium P01_D01_bin.1]
MDADFEWDELKNEVNIAKHGFDFADAYLIFRTPMVVEADTRFDYGEDRYVGIGLLEGRIVVIVYTEVDEQVVRVISLRKALSHERRRYERYLKDRLV